MKAANTDKHPPSVNGLGLPPNIKASKVGLVSRDYNKGDFSSCFEKILEQLDDNCCDTALFSLYTFLETEIDDVLKRLKKLNLKNLNNIFVELSQGNIADYLEKSEKKNKAPLVNVVYSIGSEGWQQYPYKQVFGSRAEKPDLSQYVVDFSNNRIMGNVAVVLCGETNILKLHRKNVNHSEYIDDANEFLKAVPINQIIFNPIHDRMTRYEMKLKRKHLSQGDRWVLSVWNKGKKFGETQKTRDGSLPPWTVFHDGVELTDKVVPIVFDSMRNIEIGIVDCNNHYGTSS